MDFPRLVFKDGGEQQRAGGFYSYQCVEDNAAYNSAIASGWFDSLGEALSTPEAAAVVEAPEVDDDIDEADPSREELEAKAAELGIKFDGRNSDKKLLDLITAALEIAA